MRPIRVLSTSVGWLPFGAVAFARARDERKPVLLSIVASWCQWCRDMDGTTYADPAIATLINECFVPVRVDADERPDISDRYTLGGWPTTAFLTPGGAMLGGGTHVSVDRMQGVLRQVLDGFPAHADAPPFLPSAPVASSPPLPIETLVEAIFDGVDRDHGGFGFQPKFPLTAPLHLALDIWTETHDPRYEQIVVTSLDAIGWGGLYDDVDGGFFHYAGARDWRLPHTEKLLETNAALIRVYLDAGEALGVSRFTDRAADALRYVQTWLAEPADGGWYASQEADDGYYGEPDAGVRRSRAAPAVARLQFADSNAAMASATLHAARVFEDEGLRAFALTSLERVLLAGYRPGAGAAHYNDGQPRVRGLLVDQAAMIAANLDAYEATGNVVYEMMAEELAAYAVRTMWDEAHGGFFDRADEGDLAMGLMRARLKPFVVNCDVARALRRLARTSGDSAFGETADAVLRAMAPLARHHGPLAAHYVLAAGKPSLR